MCLSFRFPPILVKTTQSVCPRPGCKTLEPRVPAARARLSQPLPSRASENLQKPLQPGATSCHCSTRLSPKCFGRSIILRF